MTVISGARAEGWRRPTRASMALFEAKATVFRLRRSRRRARPRAAAPEEDGGRRRVRPRRGRVGQRAVVGPQPRRARPADGQGAEPAPRGRRARWPGAAGGRGVQLLAAGGARDAAPAATSTAACCARAAWWRRSAAASASSPTRSTTRRWRPAATSSSGTPTRSVVPGSAAAAGRDATVAWNYVDLRFVSPEPRLLRVILGARDADGAAAGADAGSRVRTARRRSMSAATGDGVAERCSDCDQADCLLHEHGARTALAAGRAAFLVDEAWPELTDYVGRAARRRRPHGRARLPALDRGGVRRGARGAAGLGDALAGLAPDAAAGRRASHGRCARYRRDRRAAWPLADAGNAGGHGGAVAAALPLALRRAWRTAHRGADDPSAGGRAAGAARCGVRRASGPRHAGGLPRRAVAGHRRRRGAGGGGADRHAARGDRGDVR